MYGFLTAYSTGSCCFADFAFSVQWSIVIFDRLEMCKFTSDGEKNLSGSFELLDEGDFILVFCVRFFCSIPKFRTMSVSIWLVFTLVRYGLSSDDGNDYDGVSGKASKESCKFSLFLVTKKIFQVFTGGLCHRKKMGRTSTRV